MSGIRIRDGRVYARVRYGKKERLEERLPWAMPKDREAAEERSTMIRDVCEVLLGIGRRDRIKALARECATATTPAQLATIRKAVAAIGKGLGTKKTAQRVTTFKDVADDWTSGELRRKHPDHVRKKADFKLEIGRLKRYIFPLVKDVPITEFSKAHGDLVMSKLPPKRVKKSATRRHVAQIVARILNLAVMPLGLIPSSPLPRGWLPMIEGRRHYTCLFPREEAKLLACGKVTDADRLFFGILDREGMRVSELVDCEWWQWNLDEGTFTATKTKTGDPRMWAVRPDVARAMRIWHERHGKTKKRPFIDVAPEVKEKVWIATRLREGLVAAGIKRVELFESTEHTGKMRAHDLRATFVTVSLAEGKSETWIRDRTAHKTTSMIDRYRRTARQFVELGVGGLVDLVEGLGWGKTWGTLAIASGDEEHRSVEDDGGFRRKDSNLRKRNQNSVGRLGSLRAVANRREISTGGDLSIHGVPQAPPTLERLGGELVLERARWDLLDAFALTAESETA